MSWFIYFPRRLLVPTQWWYIRMFPVASLYICASDWCLLYNLDRNLVSLLTAWMVVELTGHMQSAFPIIIIIVDIYAVLRGNATLFYFNRHVCYFMSSSTCTLSPSHLFGCNDDCCLSVYLSAWGAPAEDFPWAVHAVGEESLWGSAKLLLIKRTNGRVLTN